jgi:hypothetical protein
MTTPSTQDTNSAYLDACYRLGAEVAKWMPRNKLRNIGGMGIHRVWALNNLLHTPPWSAKFLNVDPALYVKFTGAEELTEDGGYYFLDAVRDRCLLLIGEPEHHHRVHLILRPKE